jgi:hypothetical protein
LGLVVAELGSSQFGLRIEWGKPVVVRLKDRVVFVIVFFNEILALIEMIATSEEDRDCPIMTVMEQSGIIGKERDPDKRRIGSAAVVFGPFPDCFLGEEAASFDEIDHLLEMVGVVTDFILRDNQIT